MRGVRYARGDPFSLPFMGGGLSEARDEWGGMILPDLAALAPRFPTLLAYGELSLPMKGRDKSGSQSLSSSFTPVFERVRSSTVFRMTAQ
jgi:hypothetical protein